MVSREPWVLKNIATGSPQALVFAQSLPQKVFGLFAYVLPLEGRDIDIFVQNLVIDLLCGWTEEGQFLAQQDVDDCGGAPNVDFAIVSLLQDQLRGHVVYTSQ